MKILVIGQNGQVGWELQRAFAPLGEVIALDRAGCDLAQPEQVRDVVRRLQPTLIVNAAAYTAVDRAESEPDLAMAINGVAPGVLAAEARRLDAALIHYSTDYVFDGDKTTPYLESDAANPRNVYGRSKWAGEQAVVAAGGRALILRTSWVYGARGSNFLRTLLRLAPEREVLRVVNDQIGAPTSARLIADATALIAARWHGARAEHGGVYHLSCAGEGSWYDFAQALYTEAVTRGLLAHAPRVDPIPTIQYPTPAQRPANSRLNTDRLARDFGLRLPVWRTGLALCLADMVK